MKVWQTPVGLIYFIIICGNTACVGPTTPFGGLESVNEINPQRQPQSEKQEDKKKSSQYKIKFHPQRQVLHDKTDFSVEIHSSRPLDDEINIKISYNNIDVTKTFLKHSHLHRSADGQTLIYVFNDMRLKTLDMNHIKVQIVDKKGQGLVTKFFREPECSMEKPAQLAHLGEFHAPENYIGMIERLSDEAQTNPSFLAGVVAQESGFNPKAVSWAKAIGLTQITPLAEEQVIASIDHWPRYPGINDLSYFTLKSKIVLGEIDRETEWRLNPQKSLMGGLTYFQYLRKYWELAGNKELVDSLGGDRDKVLTELILASYNSGAARVKKAVIDKQHKWKQHENLKEAVRYLKKVSSYCYHYTKKEVQDDNET